mmetsp:Transcript_83725/g.200870  ORF Transcript_83725/g.200870 Transcript_83725/m.200870 type:complete len:190 (+) Transcript_83725:52-621(+)
MAARDIAVASVASVLGIGAALLVGYLRKPRIQIAKKVAVPGLGNIDVKSEVSAGKTHVTLDWNALLGIPARLPFCSAVITETGTIYVSGAVGARKGSDGKPTVVPGGPEKETVQTLRIIEACLKACGAGLDNVTMVHAYLVEYTSERFQAMNAGYMEVLGARPLPARICMGTSHVGLGGSVEMDAIAQL